jgi:hypothetical protein
MLPVPRSQSSRGQVLVIVAMGMVVFLAMVALVIDGGHAWGRQRDTQNGTDAAAEAGAVLLAVNLPFKAADETAPNTDADVLAAVQKVAGDNDIDLDSAEYTTFEGDPLGVAVGSLGDAPPPDAAEGVLATASSEFDTFLAGIIGFNQLTATTDATAVAGYLIEAPGGSVIPLTIPVTVPFCDGSGDLQDGTDDWIPGVEYVIALCKNEADGNVGWLDWDAGNRDERTDECRGNGTGELACSIEEPNNPPLQIPGWFYVTETGNTNAGQVQEAMESWIGRDVMIPIFDATCKDGPLDPEEDCPTGPGNGQGTWYHFQNWVSITLTSVHIQGSNAPCGASVGAGSGCFKGRFVNFMGPGLLGGATGEESSLAAVGTQLIE